MTTTQKQERRDIPTVWQSTVIYEDGSQWDERHESDLITRWHKKVLAMMRLILNDIVMLYMVKTSHCQN